MTEQTGGDYGREIRDTVVKSSLTGVAATMLAVTIFSPAGLGGMIGTSLASGLGSDPSVAPADNPYANLPSFPAPLSTDELSEVRAELASTTASLEITRAATEAKIEHVRSIARTDVDAAFAPMRRDVAPTRVSGTRRLALSEPAPAQQPGLVPVSYEGGAGQIGSYRGSHLELADLMFAHESF